MQDPLKYVTVDPKYTATLLDQRAAGKKLALITNSDWVYTNTMMHATYDPFLPEGMRWADLFDVVVVSACKPEFFGESRRPVYEIATADGFLREDHKYRLGRAYAGGNAVLVQRCFQVSGPEMLYVGDHHFTDVNMAKRGLSWRTCLVLQELESEMRAVKAAAACSTDGMWSARASASAAPFVLDTRDAAELTAAEVTSAYDKREVQHGSGKHNGNQGEVRAVLRAAANQRVTHFITNAVDQSCEKVFLPRPNRGDARKTKQAEANAASHSDG